MVEGKRGNTAQPEYSPCHEEMQENALKLTEIKNKLKMTCCMVLSISKRSSACSKAASRQICKKDIIPSLKRNMVNLQLQLNKIYRTEIK